MNFIAQELPVVHLSNHIQQVRQRLMHAMPEAAAIINAEFGSLEDEAAELPTELSRAG